MKILLITFAGILMCYILLKTRKMKYFLEVNSIIVYLITIITVLLDSLDIISMSISITIIILMIIIAGILHYRLKRKILKK